MAVITEDIEHLNHRLGRNFITFWVRNNMLSNTWVDLVIRVGEENIITKGAQFSGGTALVSWQFFGEVTVTGAGTDWPIIPMNQASDNQLGATFVEDPGVVEDGGGIPIGDALTPSPIDFYGTNAADNRVTIKGKLLDSDYVLLANKDYLLRIQNRHSTNSNLEVLFRFSKFDMLT